MPGDRYQYGDQVLLFRCGSHQGLDRSKSEETKNNPSSRKWEFHGCRGNDQIEVKDEVI